MPETPAPPDLSRYRPQGDFLIVQPVEIAQKTPGGIQLPGRATSNQLAVGRVLEAGPGQPLPLLDVQASTEFGKPEPIRRLAPDVSPGDLVYFRMGQGSPALAVHLDGHQVILLPFSQVILVVEESCAAGIEAPSADELLRGMDPGRTTDEDPEG